MAKDDLCWLSATELAALIMKEVAELLQAERE